MASHQASDNLKPQGQQHNQQSLSSPPSNILPAILQQSNNLILSGVSGNMPVMMLFDDDNNNDNNNNHDNMSSQNILTIKKGVLWQQQNHNKFRQKLFSRWKKRYFILTTDYLVCFKRSPSKVGRSEMGKFLYKVSYLHDPNLCVYERVCVFNLIMFHVRLLFCALTHLFEQLECTQTAV